MSQALRTIFVANEQARVRKAMSHRPVFKLDDAIPEDLADKLLRLDLAFRQHAERVERD
ncbi:hypothetical protein [Aureimonas sp. SK2]|uniref:hypothetical protein n=1 Tax=Aureimonas sp. SK2 TaxID=3015992 RepID=UPI002443EF9F|nr:hypothetical protein [Aureimonas sp. SK2]